MTTALVLAALTMSLARPDLQGSLTAAFDDECKAEAYYQAVNLKFGPSRPFSNIVVAEGRHRALVTAMFTQHGLEEPKNRYARKRDEADKEFVLRNEVPSVYLDAALKALKLERDQGPFYDDLIKTGGPSDVEQLFRKLKKDSLERHAVAFQRAVDRG
jgi:rubrerythrin